MATSDPGRVSVSEAMVQRTPVTNGGADPIPEDSAAGWGRHRFGSAT